MHDGTLAIFALDLCYECAILALTALGLAIIFGLLGVLNMAHGEFVMMGAYCSVYVQQEGWPALAALPLAVALCCVLGWVMERWLIRPLYRRPFDTLLATWGLSILLREAVKAIFGAGYQNVDLVLARPVHVAGADYPAYRLALIACTALGLTALGLWFRRSQAGARIRAMTGNPLLAQAMGIDTVRLASTSFVIGVVLAGVSGVLLAPLVRVDPYMGLNYLLNAFFVLIVGGLGTLAGLAAGTGIVAGTQSTVASLLDQTYGYAAVLLVSIVFLWLRPHGLVARR
ncbi:branched-chain amino acid ABC transporter permease [Bordetella sp. FB-8]|uniref:branched-chain amino acid ABC transporter permease n=1 Tax=Bordetella sp. FB-8 TaxID=1159870 RepID=UPI000382E688|nr:branched-chain amino acid ABC transporter permease [Bordetella sp. FB-8]